MIETELLAPPEMHLSTFSTKFDRERQAFVRLRQELLAQYRGQYVAIHDEKVVGSGDDHAAVAFAAYQQFGYVPIYVDLVADEVSRVVRV